MYQKSWETQRRGGCKREDVLQQEITGPDLGFEPKALQPGHLVQANIKCFTTQILDRYTDQENHKQSQLLGIRVPGS